MLFSYYKRPLFIILSLYCFFICCREFFFLKKPELDTSAPMELCGTVKTYPEKSRNRQRFEFEVMNLKGKPVLIAYLKNFSDISYKDEICFKGFLKRPYGAFSPGALDWRKYLEKKGVYYEVYGDNPSTVKKAVFPFFFATLMRKRLLKIFDENFSPDQSGVLSGITLGYKKNISPELKKAFTRAGAMHILVASGSNVAFVIIVFNYLFLWLGLRKLPAASLSALAAGFYTLSAGLDPPLTRAYLMSLFGMAAFYFGRKSGLFQALLISALLILIWTPRSLFEPGFQMSFMAVYGIIAGFACWHEKLRVENVILGMILNLFLVTIFAQTALFPLLAVYFKKISLVSFFSNILIVPVSAIIMFSGFFLFISSFNASFLSFSAAAVKFLLFLFIKLVYFFASFKYSSLNVPFFGIPGLLALCVLIFIFLHFPLFKAKKKILLSGLIAMTVFIFSCFLKGGNLLFLDSAGRGYGVSGGKVFLVNPFDSRIVNSVLEAGYSSIEAVFFTSKRKFDEKIMKEIEGEMSVKRVYMPFWADNLPKNGILGLWPGEENGEDFNVKALWPRRFYGPGYTGRGEEEVAYFVNGEYLINGKI